MDNVNKPKHYTHLLNGIECIEVVEHFNFNMGNAIKYVWRADHKGSFEEDLLKAIFYLNQEILKRRATEPQGASHKSFIKNSAD